MLRDERNVVEGHRFERVRLLVAPEHELARLVNTEPGVRLWGRESP